MYNNYDEETNITDSLLAYTNDLNINVQSVKNSYIMTDIDKKLLQKSLPDYNLNNIYFNKVIVDLDNDGLNEEIYIVNNFNLIDIPDKTISYVFLKTNNGDIIQIAKNESSDQNKVPAYRFSYSIDVDKDNEYEMVLSKFYNESIVSYNIYKYDSKLNKIKELK